MQKFIPQIFRIMFLRLLSVLAVLALFFYAGDASAAASVSSMRVGQGIGNIRIVFDADSQFDYKVFLLTEPRRLVVDTHNADINPAVEKVRELGNFINGVRLGAAGVDGVRIVFDLNKRVII